MSQPSPLLNSLQRAIANRNSRGLAIFNFDQLLPSSAPDFFSNDYLSLSTVPAVRDSFLRKVQAASHTRLLGSTGSRVATGNSVEYNALEKAFCRFFGSSSALLLHSGFIANMAFLATVPQEGDVILCDEMVHISYKEGIRLSSRPSYWFAHNSVASFEESLLDVLQKHPQIARGTSTVFVVLESIYSMDGDLCPLTEIVEIVESLVPAGHAHIVVDEAHSSGICGPNGTGYVSHLGLNDRVHTKIHTFGKAWGYHGAVVLTSPTIKDYMTNFAKSVIFTTSMPYTDIYALESCLDVVSSARGEELRESLNRLSRYARRKLFIATRNVPETILGVSTSDAAVAVSDHGLVSPVIPVFTPHAKSLAEYLLQRGFEVTPMMHPIVKVPRLRVIIHARNTEEEIDSFVEELVTWAEQQRSVLPSTVASAGGSAGVGEPCAEAEAEVRARL